MSYKNRFIKEENKNEFYNSLAWYRKKEKILRRDNYICQNCKRYGKMKAAETVHHIKHLEEYPELAFVDDNLISLCKSCHNKAHPEKGTKSLASQRAKGKTYY